MRTLPKRHAATDENTPHSQQPAAFTIEGAIEFSGLTRSRIYEEVGAGRIEARKAGRRTLILGDSLRAYLANLPRADIRMGRKAA